MAIRKYLLSTAAIIAVLPEIAVAQDQAASTADGLEEIIVTAQRQREDAQRAAVAIDVIKGDQLIAAGINQVDSLPKLSPALSASNGGTGSIFFVRGVGNFTVSPNSDPAIAFGYDGVYVGRPSSTTGMFYDLQRVEVLKGPQGTLYGRNATGGAINVIPVEPQLGAFAAYLTASYGNYSALTAEGAINVPLGENGGLRVSGSVSERDGYLRDGTGDDKTRSLRVQFKAELTPSLTVRVAGDYSHTGGFGPGASYIGAYAYNPVAGRYQFTSPGLEKDGFYTAAAQAYRQTLGAGTAGRKLDALGPIPFANNDFVGVNADISYDTGAGTLTIIPAWRHAKLSLLTGAAAFSYRQREQDEQFSVEARFTGTRIGPIGYQVGAYYFDETIDQRPYLSLSSAISILDQRYTTKSYAVFGRFTGHITDQFRVVGGIRYTDDKKHFSGTTIAAALVCTQIVAGAPSCPNAVLFPLVDDPAKLPFAFPPAPGVGPQIVNGLPTGAIIARTNRNDNAGLDNNRITWRAAIEYDIAPRSLFYASYETGYRSGGFSAAQGFETYDPEYIDAYTVGVKNRFLNNRLQLNVEAFYWKYRDQQVNHVGLDLAGRTANYTQNIGRSRMTGFEAEIQALATPTTLVSANVQYLNTKNKNFVYQQAVGTPGTPPPLTGCAVRISAVNSSLYDVDCAGLPSYNSPRWTVNLAGQQTVRLGDYNLILGADTQYRSSRYIGFAYLAEQRVGSTWQTNAQISFGPESDQWSIAAYVRNIENDRIPVGAGLHPMANIQTFNLGAPRTYGARVSVRF